MSNNSIKPSNSTESLKILKNLPIPKTTSQLDVEYANIKNIEHENICDTSNNCESSNLVDEKTSSSNVVDEQTSSSNVVDEQTSLVDEQASLSNVLDEQTSLVDEQTSSSNLVDEQTSNLVDEKTSSSNVIDEKTCSSNVVDEQTSSPSYNLVDVKTSDLIDVKTSDLVDMKIIDEQISSSSSNLVDEKTSDLIDVKTSDLVDMKIIDEKTSSSSTILVNVQTSSSSNLVDLQTSSSSIDEKRCQLSNEYDKPNNLSGDEINRINNEYKAEIAEILNIPNDNCWNVVDAVLDNEVRLCMVHYSDNADMNKYGHLRGIVIDLELKIIVADSYSYTPVAVAGALCPNSSGNITLEDLHGNLHDINETSICRYGLEGVMFRVFRWGGVTYYASHRKFDVSRSRWGDSPTFKQIYIDLGGPMDMFDENEKYSPYVHFFLGEHPKLLHVTKNVVKRGYLYYLECRKMWETTSDKCPFKLSDNKDDCRPILEYLIDKPRVPSNIRIGLPSLEEEMNMKDSDLPCVKLDKLTIKQANTMLRYGYMKQWKDERVDRRIRTGEFVVLYKPDGTLLRIESPSYYWRASISDDNPNRLHRFYQLIQLAKLGTYRTRRDNALITFSNKFPPMRRYDVKSVKEILEKGPIKVWNNEGLKPDLNNIKTFDQRLYNIWACLLVASPYVRQLEIVNYYDDYFAENDKFVEWTFRNRDEIISQNPDNIIDGKYAYSDQLRGLVKRANECNSFKSSMRKIIKSQNTVNLYRLIREMKQHIRFRSNDQAK